MADAYQVPLFQSNRYHIFYSEKFDPVAGTIGAIDGDFIRVEAGDGSHIIRLSQVNHIKIPNENIEGFERVDL